jgi:Flp pilus assembly protein TadG
MLRIKQAIRHLRRRSSQRGQGLVEFALVLPVLILLLIGMMEFGYFFFIYSSANTAAREAVRYGSAAGDSAASVPYYQDCAGIREVATRIGRYANIQNGDITINYDDGPGTASLGTCADAYDPALGQRIVVQVDVTYHPIIALLNLPDIDIHAESARTIVKRVQVGG